MESGPDSPQPLELGVAAGRESPPEGRRHGGREAEDGLAGRAEESGGGQGAAAARSSPGDPTSPSQLGCGAGSDLKDSASPSPAASEAPPRGQHKVTASPELAEAAAGRGSGPVADAGTCRVEQAAEEPSSAGALSSSCSEPSPPGDSPSLDSLESFSNLHSFPSSSEFNSEEGAETRVPEDVEEGAAGPPRAAPLCKEEEEEEDPAQVLAASKERFPGQSVYHIKWIQWKEENTPIITQNENGPCPLLAILNVLLLAWKVKLPPMMEIITAEQLMEYLGDYMLEAKPKEISEIQRVNYEQNMSDAMAILHKLQTGLDVNVRFTGVRVFEYTPECIVFDLLDIPLYHGWLVDPQGQLYLLVTDQGFLTEEKVVWESLHNVDGDGNFCDSEFHLRPPSDPETVYKGQQDQIDQDYLMALSLQQEQQSQDINWEQIPEGISDLELAKKLQEEEDRRASQYYQEQEQAQVAVAAATTSTPVQQAQPAQASPSSVKQPGNSERKRKEPREKDKEKEKEKNSCVIL
ncbi:ubiquitin carboxyl-terminal hydrolase MINDY-2 isoform X2 [Peromyscus leucopus]|uniref:ubiquitin carboxyl-terminal hydrolase MINDY-2 isoform X2 n=1 Tax=Peromyscus leucopus TaxID=10041 RepID=UPI0010A190A3|nr:ubiquitin carboxyl-terminal hydrolase MINDY-2 isoform X2 [Peromyscus leucopus]